MTGFRFIHTSDLHLGRGFSNYPDDIRDRLRNARHGALARLAEAARRHGARHVLVAGDVFDSETPSDPVWRQALAAMAREEDITWLLLPGNHDSLAAEALWDRLSRRSEPNVTTLLEEGVRELEEGVALLAAPASHRYPGRDLTEWMDEAVTDPQTLRIGLAHGAVQRFGEDDAHDIIAPDRAALARLDYLALGDWHGRVRIDDRTWYSGAPERDRFRHRGRGECLAVTLAGPGATPDVTPIEIGQHRWLQEELTVLPGEDAAEALAALLPARAERRDTLLRIRAAGRAGLAQREALMRAGAAAAPEFGYFELDDSALATEAAPDDLDEIGASGALRAAADRLDAETRDPALPEEGRDVARAALARLFGMLQEDEA